MSSESPQQSRGAATMRLVCALVFMLFSFVYLYFYQADVLAVAQHVLSGGVTTYNRLLGALLITAVLLAMQAGIFALTGLRRRNHALTYFPSFLILTVITDISPNIDLSFSFGGWLVAFPLLLIAWGGLVYLCRKYQPYEHAVNSAGFFSRIMWQNLLAMLLMMVLTCAISTGDKAFHYRAHMETALTDGNYQEALSAGQGSTCADSSLTMLRTYALSRTHQLGESFFNYPVVGGTSALLPDGKGVRAMMLSNKAIRRQILHDKDFPIVKALVERNLPKAVDLLVKTYGRSGHYPRQFKEAFVLYNKLTVNPKYKFSSPTLEADYDDMTTLLRSSEDQRVKMSLLHDNYSGTYWEYYLSDQN